MAGEEDGGVRRDWGYVEKEEEEEEGKGLLDCLVFGLYGWLKERGRRE